MNSAPSFQDIIYSIMGNIPSGRVVTYGVLAKMAGYPAHVRQVCRAIRNIPPGSTLPCHRVINSQGKLSVTGECYLRHKQALIHEGIVFNANDKIKLKDYLWEGGD
ncbi:MGMT family protein [Providencia huaxiensis]|uniref:MGMT family protein n=1 Tax=Providencia TaxID=586 RepID=UPI000F7A9FFF|nr:MULTISPECIES: MGMT family protein [Providencia]ELR5070352.1 MGMT family protein [Providencia rettgeri]ELR5073563.1 MGMT family protein [Providencia stuartii]MBV2189439.1 MGMT family protein [Providencia rettgeri]UPS62426.1 MGMT family protein [Providencia rettgeri]